MCAYYAVEVHCQGWGAMQIFKENMNPAFTVNRNSVHLFDGEDISFSFDANKR
jgi:hypothetical protein